MLYQNPIVKKPGLSQTIEALQKNPAKELRLRVHEKFSVVIITEPNAIHRFNDNFSKNSNCCREKLNWQFQGFINCGYYLNPNPHGCHPG